MRREGRPPERATLIARLIDRPMRPLFPSWMRDEIQIVASCLGDCDKIIQVSTYCLVRDSPVQLGTSNRRYAEQHQDEAFTCNHHIRTSTVMSGDNIIFETHELLVRFNSNLK